MPNGIFFAILTVIMALFSIWSLLMYRAFSYNGKRQMSRQIIEGVAKYVKVPDGGVCLDVGCGSGALSIACAERNQNAKIVGIDRWGKHDELLRQEGIYKNFITGRKQAVSWKLA